MLQIITFFRLEVHIVTFSGLYLSDTCLDYCVKLFEWKQKGLKCQL